jgi:hypothetical protein
MSRKSIHSRLVVADLGRPEVLDLLGILAGIQHPPAIDPKLAVGKPNGRQFQAHAFEPGDKRFNIKFRHFQYPPNHHDTTTPIVLSNYTADKATGS